METPPGAGTGGFCLGIKGVGMVKRGDRTHVLEIALPRAARRGAIAGE